jgi:energy-converting hydrogenase Eha subunit E
MMRNMGGAIGPVLATTIMNTYTVTLHIPGRGLIALPSSTAFDYIFYLAIGTMIVAILLAVAAKNYVFAKEKGVPF